MTIDNDDECMEDPSECSGELIEHWSDLGTRLVRCDNHFMIRERRMEEINRNYPDSPMAPAWFDPSYAGERWDDDY